MSSVSEDGSDLLINYDTSKGSSVSSGLQEEYDELLKYAIVTPKWEPQVQANVGLPQLRLYDPDQVNLTTVDEYSETTPSECTKQDGHDSAVGSEEITSDRRTFREAMPPPNVFQPSNNRMTSSAFVAMAGKSTSTLGVPQLAASGESCEVEMDPDMKRLHSHLNDLYAKMNNSVLAEVSHMKISMNENFRREMHALRLEHETKINQLQDEVSNLKELLHTYEGSLARKDSVISNLTRALQSGKERQEMARALHQWKMRLVDERRQAFTSRLARRHRDHVISTRVWQGWRSLVEGKWREKVEKACQRKAQEVCRQLTDDYEAKLASLNEALESSRDEVRRLHNERDQYEETMKKAFMRGVCALNLEAMTMFHGEENEPAKDELRTLAGAVDALTCASSGQQQPQPVFTQAQRGGNDVSQPDSLNSDSGVKPFKQNNSAPAKTSQAQRPIVSRAVPLTGPVRVPAGRTRTLQAKISATGVQTPPVRQTNTPQGSVLVERHHPNLQNISSGQPLAHVTKQPNTPSQPIRSRGGQKGGRSSSQQPMGGQR